MKQNIAGSIYKIQQDIELAGLNKEELDKIKPIIMSTKYDIDSLRYFGDNFFNAQDLFDFRIEIQTNHN